MKRLLLFAAALLFAVSCTESEVDDTITLDPDDEITVVNPETEDETEDEAEDEAEADQSQDSTTINRVVSLAVVANGDNITTTPFCWSDGDALLAWSANGEMSKLTMSEFGESTSTFEGEVSDSTFRLFTPYVDPTLIEDGCYTIDVSSQTEGSAPLYLITEEMVSEDDIPSMMHIGGAIDLKLEFQNLPTTNYTLTKVELLNVPTSVAIDLDASLTSSEFYGAESVGNIAVDVADVIVTGSDLTVDVNILPFEVAASDSLAIKLYFESAGEVYYLMSYLCDSLAAMSFPRASYSTVTYDCDMSKISITLDGSGTESDPYIITTSTHLAALSAEVSAGNAKSGIFYKISNDIDLQGSESNQWTPIGNSSTNFQGTFDGGGHEISGLYINTEDNYQGLFGLINNATITNLGVSGEIHGGVCTGGIAGLTLNNSTITNCYNKATVIGTSNYIGGISGALSGNSSITDCYNTGDVSGAEYIGGISGESYSATLNNCYNTGVINGTGSSIGGVVGYARSTSSITNCYNEGDVSGTDKYISGIVGLASESPVTDCYNEGDVSGTTYVSGVIGYSSSAVTTNCYNTGDVSGTSYVNGIIGQNAQSSTTIITNCYNTGTISGTDNYVGGISGFAYLATFTNCYNTGTIDGTASYSGGIVGCGSSCTNTNCYNTGEVNGGSYVGGIGGLQSGSATTNCYNTGKICGESNIGGISGRNRSAAINNCYNRGDIYGTCEDGYSYVGGIAGYNNSYTYIVVTISYNTSYMSINNCYSTGVVQGVGDYVGGVVGYDFGLTKNSYYDNTTYTGSAIGVNDSGSEEIYNVISISTSEMQSADFIVALNNAAATLNMIDDVISNGLKACTWIAVSGDYPTLDFDTAQ